MKSKISKIIMLITILVYAIYNIAYIASVKGDIQCFGASMIFESIESQSQKKLNLLLFLCFIIIMSVTYIIILIDKKEKDNKGWLKSFIFIAIVSVLSGIILPNNSSDVYYYIASGRLDAKYHINVFEENFKEKQIEHMDDKVVARSPACDQKFIYGPVWSAICKFIGSLPTNIVVINLYAFKILNILVHLLNCYLIYKISKNKKYVFLYGLNPLLLFEGIMNCHNDIYLVLFILLAVYLKRKEKRGLAVISIALRNNDKICSNNNASIYNN